MTTPATAPRRPPPPPPKRPPSNGDAVPAPTRTLTVSEGVQEGPLKVVIYGPGGIGKSELAANLSQLGIRPLFIDLEAGSLHLNCARVLPETWDEMRAILHDEIICSQYGAIVIDSATKAEEMAAAWTLQNVPHEKGHVVDSIEGYGFGKGVVHVYETFLRLLGDLDQQARKGRHVIVVAHECVANVPNPTGEDWIRYEPRLQSPASGKSSIRHRIKEWCGHLLYISYDAAVSKDGKAIGSGTRTIYSSEMPSWWAKSRTISQPIPYTQGSAELWSQLLSERSE